MIMSAKQAQEYQEQVVADKRAAELAATKEAKKREARHRVFTKETLLPELLVKVEQMIKDQIKNSSHSPKELVFTCGSNAYLQELVVAALVEAGYKATALQPEYVPEYGGSVDDGHAYARDAYWNHDVLVGWK